MKPATCIIVDDEPLAIRLLTAHVQQVAGLDLVESFDNPLAALSYLRNHPVDLVFLDIQMPVFTGLEFARTLKPAPAIVFTTAYRDYAVESYELAVVDYLVKPIAFPRFYQAIDRFFALQQSNQSTGVEPKNNVADVLTDQEQFRYFNVNKKHVKVYLKDITYIESLKDYIRIHTEAQSLTTREKISDFATTLPACFLRTHRSFIVNIQHITAYTAHDIEIGAQAVPIGVSYKLNVMDKLQQG